MNLSSDDSRLLAGLCEQHSVSNDKMLEPLQTVCGCVPDPQEQGHRTTQVMIDDVKRHLFGIRLRLNEMSDCTSDRKQLQVVNEAVEQLTRLGISVPEDLRSLKLRLSSKGGTESQLGAFDTVVEELQDLTRLARRLRESLKTGGALRCTKQHKEVTLLALLRSGLLSEHDKLELAWAKTPETFEGKVSADGVLLAKTSNGWRKYSSLSGAAMELFATSTKLSGWLYWRLVNRDGSRTPLSEIRDRYLTNKEEH
jgi:hypothetical protein